MNKGTTYFTLKECEDSIYFRLKECAELADVIEAAETGYISLNGDDIRKLDRILLEQISGCLNRQNEKVASAATLATND